MTLILAVSYYYGVIAYQALENALNMSTFFEFLISFKAIYENKF